MHTLSKDIFIKIINRMYYLQNQIDIFLPVQIKDTSDYIDKLDNYACLYTESIEYRQKLCNLIQLQEQFDQELINGALIISWHQDVIDNPTQLQIVNDNRDVSELLEHFNSLI